MDFQFDVFLSQCSNNKPLVPELTALLPTDDVRVWLDAKEIRFRKSTPSVRDNLIVL